MYESSAFAVGGKVARRSIFQTLDDGLDVVRSFGSCTTADVAYRLARSIVPDDQREGRMKLDCLAARVVERADSSKVVAISIDAVRPAVVETYPRIESLSIFAVWNRVQSSSESHSIFQ